MGIGLLTQGPAPGVAEEGSDEDAYAIEELLGGNFRRLDKQIPILPPSTNARPGPSQAPFDVMPQDSDPTGQRSDEKMKLEKIPEKPSVPKPGPPKAPEVLKRASQESDNKNKTEEDSEKKQVVSVSNPESFP